MIKYIILLRGINVGGQKKVPMSELRRVLDLNGYKKVQSYIQSGNIILESDEKNGSELETMIERLIEKHFGFFVPTIVKTYEQLSAILKNCPFKEDEIKESYFTLLHTRPNAELVRALLEINIPKETFVISDKCVYFHSSTGYGKAKANNNFFERKLKVTSTTRNYNTIIKLLNLSQEN